MSNLSIVIPAKNEAASLGQLLPEIKSRYPNAEIIVVNDGSTDETESVCKENGVHVHTHPYSVGNGAAVKSGARNTSGDIIVFMDADGQHRPEDIEKLLVELANGNDMVIGSRNSGGQANVVRGLANKIYSFLATWMTGQIITDLTSGFRAVDAKKFRSFLSLLPNGFSYPTTITMAFARAGYLIKFVPITVLKRVGKSHIRPIHDGLRFLLIIFRVGTLYSPLKLFVPISISFFFLGFGYYMYTFINFGRFTNMSALLFITSVLVFLIGLVSEQITNLIYINKN